MSTPERKFVLEAGNIMSFQRSLGRDATFDAAAVAPLTFSQALAHYDPDSHLRPRPGVPWKGSGRTASGVPLAGEGWLHAEQHFSFERHPRAGETLAASTKRGERWSKSSSSGSTLEFAEEITEFRDDTGALVLTSTIVRVRRSEATG